MKDILVRRILKKGSTVFLSILGGDKKIIDSNFEENSKRSLSGNLFLAKCGISITIFYLVIAFLTGNIAFLLLGLFGVSELGFKVLWLFVLIPSVFIIIAIIKTSIIESKKKSDNYNLQKYWFSLNDADLFISLLIALAISLILKY